MKQRLILVFALLFVVVVLVGLNAASYASKEQIPDLEEFPNRSTFNSGSTGTRAFHDLLVETGRNVVRWREPITRKFEVYDYNQISTFIIVGRQRRQFDPEEIDHLLNWVSAGGQLVLIDREPVTELLVTSAPWEITLDDGKNALSGNEKAVLISSVDPGNPSQMTARTAAAKAVQPSLFTLQINGVQPSKFAMSVRIDRVRESDFEKSTPVPGNEGFGTGVPVEGPPSTLLQGGQPPPPPVPMGTPAGIDPELPTGDAPEEESENGEPEEIDYSRAAPVIHLSNGNKDILADFPFGAGRIVLLTDPYIVSNGGIGLVDNAELALNIVDSYGGTVAFDEYHQGFGSEGNMLVAYFSGTPVVPIFLQFIVLLGLILYSRGKRFARPLPDEDPDRLSKLEYVAAMAQLQSRTKAYDLAVENIYTDFRRRVSRFFGVDNYTVSRKELAELISERLGTEELEIYNVMRKCEDVMHGEPAAKKQVVALVKRLREIEDRLGLQRGNQRTVKRR